MKELEFLESINDLDPVLLEENAAPQRRSGKKLVRRAVLAAAAVLLLCGTVYAVARGIEMRKTERPSEQGYEAKAELPLVQWSSFRGEIQNVGETIARQYETWVPEPVWSSYYRDPGTYGRSFDSIAEAVAYIGLEELKTPTFPLEEYRCAVAVHGDKTGRVDRVVLNAEHIRADAFTAQESVTVLTEAAKDAAYVSGGVWTWEFPRDVEFLTYVTPGGNECRIAVLYPQYDNEFMSLTGYAASGPALYELNLGAVPKTDYEQALEILHAWADALD